MDKDIDVREYGLIDLSNAKLESHGNQGTQAGKTSVPKFASFRPKEPASIRNDEKNGTADESRGGDKPQVRTGHRKHRHSHRPKEERTGRHNDSDRQPKIKDEAATSLAEDTKPQADVYVVDRVGDPKNQVYGSLDRYTTSRYFRAGAGSVIGGESGLKIDRTISDEKGVLLSVQEGSDHHARQPLKNSGRIGSQVFRVKKESCV